jgi:hypothetical protein
MSTLTTAPLLAGRTPEDFATEHAAGVTRLATVRAAALAARTETVAVLAAAVAEVDRLRQTAA